MISFRVVPASGASALVIGASLELVSRQRTDVPDVYSHAQCDSRCRGRQQRKEGCKEINMYNYYIAAETALFSFS